MVRDGALGRLDKEKTDKLLKENLKKEQDKKCNKEVWTEIPQEMCHGRVKKLQQTIAYCYPAKRIHNLLLASEELPGLIILTLVVLGFCEIIWFLCSKQINVNIQNKTRMFGKAVLKNYWSV